MRSLLAAALCLPALWLAPNRPSDRAVLLAAPTGDTTLELRRASADGRSSASLHLDLRTLDRFPQDARLLALEGDVEADAALLAVALAASADEVGYHFLLAQDAFGSEPTWILSEPIFRSRGEPYRIVDVDLRGGDAGEITFRRGSHFERESVVDDLVFVETCGVVPQLLEGKSRLIDVRSGESVEPGSLR